MQGIYKITHIATGRFYIGSAVIVAKRWREHVKSLNDRCHKNHKLQAAWDKYGTDAFEFTLLERVRRRSLLAQREQHYLDTLQPHYNIARDARSPMRGRKQTPEHIAKRLASRGVVTITEAQKKAISASLKGRTTGPCPEDRRQRISATLKGHSVSAETLRKIQENRGEWHHTEEAKTRIGRASSARPRKKGPEASGAKLTQQEREEICMRYKPRVVTLEHLAEKYGVNRRTIWEVLREGR